MSSSNPSPVIPSEVGWQFVPQYYTFVNKQPNRLHCFYTKASTFIHGTEGEDGKPCYGQQEIHNKITSIGFQDCKVFIHSVDAQSSASGGIIIQVIGEMSNHNEPWRKFVQTFFLAEQPNGYFVLNDIFRFLKEETVDSDDGVDAADEATPATNQESAPAQDSTQPSYEPTSVPREPTPLPTVSAPVPAPAPPSPAPTEDPPTSDIPEPPTIVQKSPNPPPEPLPTSTSSSTTTTVQPPAQPNGIHLTTAPEPEKPAVTPAPVVAEESPTPAPPSPVLAPAASVPAAAAPPAAAAATSTPSASAPPPAAPAPAAPRSWASLAASNPRKWGSAVAQESRGTTEIPVAVHTGPNPNTGGAPGAQTPPRAPPHHHHPHQHQGPAGGQGQQGLHPNYIAAQNTTVAQCFVKGVIEPISQTTLTAFLTQRFGAVKDVEIVRSKACAFLEFLSLDAARRAIIASLPQGQGGEGGLWIEVGGDVGQVRISVEMKKERGDRPVSRPRGGAPGAPVNGEAAGSGQGVGGGAGRGSGGGGGGNFRGRGGMRGRGGGGGGGGSGAVGK